ncbi:MAG: VWA domain-containing protein [Halothiobacillus sp.]
MSALSLAAPLWLLALIPLPWLWAPLRRLVSARAASIMLRHPLITGLDAPLRPSRAARWVPGLWLAAYAALVLTLTDPTWQGDFIPAPPPARSILLVVDASPSMQAEDFPTENGQFISRMAAMRQGLLRFIAARPHDRFSVVVVTGSAGTLVPMTADHAVITYWVRQLTAGINGSDTALGDGLAVAISHIAATSQAGQPAPLLVVWTDGFSTGGLMTPAEALALAHAHNIHIYTVNLAPVGSTPDDGQPSLAQLADLTGGKPILAGDLAAMNAVANQIAASETPISARPTERQQRPLYAGLLLLTAALLLAAQGLLIRDQGGRA